MSFAGLTANPEIIEPANKIYYISAIQYIPRNMHTIRAYSIKDSQNNHNKTDHNQTACICLWQSVYHISV